MTNTIPDGPIRTDDDALPLLDALIDKASRQQLWFLPLDDAGFPMKLVIPMDVPRRPSSDSVDAVLDLLDVLGREAGAGSVIVVVERPGTNSVRITDREWLRTIRRAASSSTTRVLGPYLCHDDGIVTVPLEVYDVRAAS